MVSLGLVGAFIAGCFALLSPCSALLLPAFFATAFASRTELVKAVTIFYLGLAATLIPVGVSASALGRLITTQRETVILIGGLVMIGFGVMAALGKGFSIPGVERLSAKTRGRNPAAIFFLGCVYGFTGFCAGPLLGAVLTTAALATTSIYAAGLMAAYAFGMAVPLLILAALWDSTDIGSSQMLRGKVITIGPISTTTTQLAAGLLFIVIGVAFIISDGMGSVPQLVDLETQIAWQAEAGRLAQGINDMYVVFALALLAAGFFIWRLTRSQSGRQPSPTRDADAPRSQ